MKKKTIIIIIIALLVIVNIPRRYALKDGGTVIYKSILWEYAKVHRMNLVGGYDVGTTFDILGIPIVDTVVVEE